MKQTISFTQEVEVISQIETSVSCIKVVKMRKSQNDSSNAARREALADFLQSVIRKDGKSINDEPFAPTVYPSRMDGDDPRADLTDAHTSHHAWVIEMLPEEDDVTFEVFRHTFIYE